MGLESGTYIDSLNASNPVGANDPKSEGDNHIRLVKSTILATFPNLTGAMTATQAELNILDGATMTTAELNYIDGVTSAIQTQLDAKAALGANSDITSLAGLTTALSIAQGGTGLTSFTAGDLLYATGATTLVKLAKGTANQVVGMNAGATAPEYKTVTGGDNVTVTHSANDIDIASSGVSANSIGSSEMKNSPASTGNQVISISSSWTPAAGVYNMVTADTNHPNLQLNISGWKGGSATTAGAKSGMGFVNCDGSNMRYIEGGDGAVTVYYQKF